MSKGYCRKCRKKGLLTIHHWQPRRANRFSRHTVLLCRDCHNQADRELLTAEVHGYLSLHEYRKMITQFLNTRMGAA